MTSLGKLFLKEVVPWGAGTTVLGMPPLTTYYSAILTPRPISPCFFIANDINALVMAVTHYKHHTIITILTTSSSPLTTHQHSVTTHHQSVTNINTLSRFLSPFTSPQYPSVFITPYLNPSTFWSLTLPISTPIPSPPFTRPSPAIFIHQESIS
ncbi:hypothetical protein E2C01_050946 [Portunus trituberculatus]|uniref:Uncharacterized protein n=1 Tax=Portunus trituberculatus TaxID=210409 RepID=A0A5B7GIW1_PORTR|nr:hypothetical protein [Portunus trituberculatus]